MPDTMWKIKSALEIARAVDTAASIYGYRFDAAERVRLLDRSVIDGMGRLRKHARRVGINVLAYADAAVRWLAENRKGRYGFPLSAVYGDAVARALEKEALCKPKALRRYVSENAINIPENKECTWEDFEKEIEKALTALQRARGMLHGRNGVKPFNAYGIKLVALEHVAAVLILQRHVLHPALLTCHPFVRAHWQWADKVSPGAFLETRCTDAVALLDRLKLKWGKQLSASLAWRRWCAVMDAAEKEGG